MQTAKLVKLWKENINPTEPNPCSEVWFTIRKELAKYGGKKAKEQCTDKLNSLIDLYKKTTNFLWILQNSFLNNPYYFVSRFAPKMSRNTTFV